MKTTLKQNGETAVQYETENDIPKAVRGELVEILNQRLADIIDLQTQLKQAHWNVKGPHFIGLHELFDKIAEGVESYVDMIAERVVQMGGIAKGTARVTAALRSCSSQGTPSMSGWNSRFAATNETRSAAAKTSDSVNGSGSARAKSAASNSGAAMRCRW